MEPSKAELIRQIDREGKPWGLSHMISVFGEVLVAELVPCKVNLGNGISVIEDVKRDVARMSVTYPFSSVLRNRLKREDRVKFMGLEIRHMNEMKAQQQKMEPIYHELEQDLKKAKKGRLIIGGR
jgi:hypothetical protein